MATMNFNGTVAANVGVDPASKPVSSDPVRVFPDANLAAAVRTACGLAPGADIHQSDLDKVTTFTANSLEIVDLTGVEYWTTLTDLALGWNSIVDISALAGLTSLTVLYLSGNSILDISPLSTLTSLLDLTLDSNVFIDISDLSTLTSLIALELSNNSIVDISPIAMTSGDLYIKNNPLNAAAYSTYIPALIALGVTVDYDPAWRSPDGFVDTLGSWSDEALAYDGNTATYAYVAQNLNMWCDWVRFTFSAPVLTPSQFRIWMSHEVGATPNMCHVKAYDGVGGEETLIYDDIAHDQYVTVNVTTLTKVSYFEVRFQGQTGVTKNIYLNEVGVYGK